MQKSILKILLAVSIQLSVFSFQLSAQEPNVPFAAGVDISWCTEMEADGMKFYDLNGNETEIYQLMSDIGMTATRIRVWVNPETYGPKGTAYGPWSNKVDVVAKCKRAHAAGLDILIDFHYSDYFADPGKQAKPGAWAGHSFDQLKSDIAAHTKDVLGAIKAEGIDVKWVQVGNETSGGMVYDDGRIMWNTSSLAASWQRYAALSNAGYDAVKSVYPNAYVIVHHDNGDKDNSTYYQTFKQYGGKFDMIGLSYYPDEHLSHEAFAESVQDLPGTGDGRRDGFLHLGYLQSRRRRADRGQRGSKAGVRRPVHEDDGEVGLPWYLLLGTRGLWRLES